MQFTQNIGVEGSEVEWKIYMDMDFIKKAFLKELSLARGLTVKYKI